MNGDSPPRVGGGRRLSAAEILDRLVARYGDKIRAATPVVAAGGGTPEGGTALSPVAPQGGTAPSPLSPQGGNIARFLPGGAPYAVVPREHLSPILAHLRDDPEFRFDALMDVTVVDHLLLEVPEIPERYAVVYQLASLFHGHRFQVKVAVPEDDPRVPSVSALWRSAHWGEREAHDMFGIKFEGNQDLRRLLMPENYPGFPLRKDYPLRGRGERDSFPQFRPGGAPAGEAERQGQPAV